MAAHRKPLPWHQELWGILVFLFIFLIFLLAVPFYVIYVLIMSNKQVWLVYEDDYGGTFSPYVLTKVCESEKEASDFAKGKLSRVVKYGYNGTLDASAYPYYHGGKYAD